jgi:hypothetical protein
MLCREKRNVVCKHCGKPRGFIMERKHFYAAKRENIYRKYFWCPCYLEEGQHYRMDGMMVGDDAKQWIPAIYDEVFLAMEKGVTWKDMTDAINIKFGTDFSGYLKEKPENRQGKGKVKREFAGAIRKRMENLPYENWTFSPEEKCILDRSENFITYKIRYADCKWNSDLSSWNIFPMRKVCAECGRVIEGKEWIYKDQCYCSDICCYKIQYEEMNKNEL